jgi:uncharacterized phage-associated protein
MLAIGRISGLTRGQYMITAHDVANAFIKLHDDDSGDVLTNLKLQKLVYYAQGFHLALFDEPLFNENLVAWEHGPVVVDLYHELKQFGSSEVVIESAVSDEINTDKMDLINEINEVYGQFSAWKLRDMTHSESPWQSTESGKVITHNKLSTYFKTQLK